MSKCTTIREVDISVQELIENHHVYGAQVIINALCRASEKESYLDEDTIIDLVKKSFEHMAAYEEGSL